jgi:hypothetical protein
VYAFTRLAYSKKAYDTGRIGRRAILASQQSKFSTTRMCVIEQNPIEEGMTASKIYEAILMKIQRSFG